MLDNSFDEFVHGHIVALDRYALALTTDRRAADNLVQETLARVAGAWRRVNRDGNPAGYATTTMFRTHISRWRWRRGRATVELTGDPASPSETDAATDRRLTLRLALRRLPRLQHAVLVATYLQDHSDDEIAEMTGRNPAAVRLLRQQGLIALHTAMASSADISSAGINSATLPDGGVDGAGLESLLREEFGAPGEPPRALDPELLINVRHLRRRRTITSSAATVVVFLVVAALVTTVVKVSGSIDSSDRPHSAPTAINPSAFERMGAVIASNPGLPTAGRMVDAQHGFLMTMRCRNLTTSADCTPSLFVTTDGGTTFVQGPPLPVTTLDLASNQIFVFDAKHLVLDVAAGVDMSALPLDGPSDYPSDFPTDFPSYFPSGFPSDLPSGMFTALPPGFPSDFPTDLPSGFPSFPPNLPLKPAARWVTSDGGSTWRSVSTKPVGTVATIPPGGQLQVMTDSDTFLGGSRSHPNVSVMSPDGTTRTLTGAPDASPYSFESGQLGAVGGMAIGGSYFLAKDDDTTMVSKDQGATWQAARLPDKDEDLAVLGAGGGRIFGEATSHDDSPDSLVISTDGGLVWTTLPMPAFTPIIAPAPDPSASDDDSDLAPDNYLSMAVLPNGVLMMCDGAALWRLPAGSSTFKRVDEDTPTRVVITFPGAMLAFRGDPEHPSLAVTTDGTHWTTSKIK